MFNSYVQGNSEFEHQTAKPQPEHCTKCLNHTGWHCLTVGDCFSFTTVSPASWQGMALGCMLIRQEHLKWFLSLLFSFVNFQFCPGSQIWTREAGSLFCSLPILWPWLHNSTLLSFCFLADEVGKMLLLSMCCIHPLSCQNTLKTGVWVKMTWWVEDLCLIACIILLICGTILRCNVL